MPENENVFKAHNLNEYTENISCFFFISSYLKGKRLRNNDYKEVELHKRHRFKS